MFHSGPSWAFLLILFFISFDLQAQDQTDDLELIGKFELEISKYRSAFQYSQRSNTICQYDSLISGGFLQYGIRDLSLPQVIIQDTAVYQQLVANQYSLTSVLDFKGVAGFPVSHSSSAMLLKGGELKAVMAPKFRQGQYGGGAQIIDFTLQDNGTFTIHVALIEDSNLVYSGYLLLNDLMECYDVFEGHEHELDPHSLRIDTMGRIYYAANYERPVNGTIFTGNPKDSFSIAIWTSFEIDSAGIRTDSFKMHEEFPSYWRFRLDEILASQDTDTSGAYSYLDMTHVNSWDYNRHGGPYAVGSMRGAGIAIVNTVTDTVAAIYGSYLRNDFVYGDYDTIWRQHDALLFGDTLTCWNNGTPTIAGSARVVKLDLTTMKGSRMLWEEPIPDTLRSIALGSFAPLKNGLAMINPGAAMQRNVNTGALNLPESYGILYWLDTASREPVAQVHFENLIFPYAWRPALNIAPELDSLLSLKISVSTADSCTSLHSPWGEGSFWQLMDSTGTITDLGFADSIAITIGGTYWVSHYISNWIQAVDKMEVTGPVANCSFVGVEPVATPAAVSVYPNPAEKELHIKGLEGVASYSIFSLYGQLLQQGSTTGDIQLNNLAAGVYLLQMDNTVMRFVVDPR